MLRRVMMAATSGGGGGGELGNLRQLIVSDFPVAYLPLADGATVSPASAAAGGNLTVAGSYPASGWGPAAGLWPGAGGSVNATSAQALGITLTIPGSYPAARGWSLGIVVKRDAAPGAIAMIVSGDQGARRFQIRTTATGLLEVIFFRGSSPTILTTSAQVCDGVAHLVHVVDDYAGLQGRAYVDGAQVGSITLSAVAADLAQDQMQIGARSGANPWRGQLSDFAFYYRALSPARIAAQAQAFLTGTAAKNPTPGHRYWRITSGQTSGGALLALQEMEIRNTPGGSSQNGLFFTRFGGQGLESSSFDSTSVALRLCDGELSNPGLGAWTTGVSPSPSAPQWAMVILPEPQLGQEVALYPQNRSDLISRAPASFILEKSKDGDVWETACSVSGITGWSMGVWKTFSM